MLLRHSARAAGPVAAAFEVLTPGRQRRYLLGLLARPKEMRIALNIVGVLCSLIGCVWILQGINILPGSFMTGQTKWAIYGSLLTIIGVGLVIRANRRRD